MRQELEKKVERSLRLLRSITHPCDGAIEVAYSGGKDSDVILQLAKESGIRFRAIYKNTTVDPPGTIKHAMEMGAEVLRPKRTFFQLIEDFGYPNMWRRFCCGYLKEYKVLDKVVMGVRKSESRARNDRYNEPSECRYYGAKKPENHVEAFYPILDWTDEDVEEFLKDRGIKCAPYYYDDEGNFHVERRLGCMCCPLMYYKKRISAFKEHPGMVKAYLRADQKYRDNPKHRNAKALSRYKDVYERFYRDLFCGGNAKWEEFQKEHPNADYKAMLEEEFSIKL